MFCPRCNQEQISEDVKFCSRCGFPLSLVPELLANSGALPRAAETKKIKKHLTRRNGLLFSFGWFVFITYLASFLGKEYQYDAVMIGLLGTMSAVFFVAASFVFLTNEPEDAENLNHAIPAVKVKNLRPSRQTALPPQQSQSAQSYVSAANSWKAPDTGDLVQPHSVTDGTTKLLEKDK